MVKRINMILLSPKEMGLSSSPHITDFQVVEKRRDLENIPASLGRKCWGGFRIMTATCRHRSIIEQAEMNVIPYETNYFVRRTFGTVLNVHTCGPTPSPAGPQAHNFKYLSCHQRHWFRLVHAPRSILADNSLDLN
jgi:hypothetical protein